MFDGYIKLEFIVKRTSQDLRFDCVVGMNTFTSDLVGNQNFASCYHILEVVCKRYRSLVFVKMLKMILKKFYKLLFCNYITIFLMSSNGTMADDLEKYKLRFYADGSFFVTPLVPNVLFQIGKIESDQYSEFRRAIVNHGVSTIVLDSPGGNVYESLDMAGTIFDRALSTYVPIDAVCLSACAFMFFAGKERFVAGNLGVHQTSYDDEISDKTAKIGEVDSAAQLSTADIIQYLNEFRTPPKVYEWMLRTPPDEMHIFSNQELISLGINSAFSKSQRAKIEAFISDLRNSMQVMSCNEDAKTCTDEQICGKAAADAKWLSIDEAQPYISEAKSRSLSCGVPIATCLTDINVCSNEELCKHSVVVTNGEIGWAEDDVANSYVSLAKSRKLTCGVPPEAVCSPSTAASCSSSELCKRATTGNAYKNNWSSDTRAKPYVLESKSRGLTCGVNVQKKDQVASCSNTPKMCNNDELCRRATNIINHRVSWAFSSDAKPYVDEAKRNGLDCVQFRNPAIAVKTWTRTVQTSLNRVGCNVGTVDGIAGRKTNFALSSAAKQLSMPFSVWHLNDIFYLTEINKRLNDVGSMKNCTIKSESVSNPISSVGTQQVSKIPAKPAPKEKEPGPSDGARCAADIGLTALTGGWWLLFGGASCF